MDQSQRKDFASNYFVFGSSLRTCYEELIWCTSQPNVHIYTFRKRWSFILVPCDYELEYKDNKTFNKFCLTTMTLELEVFK